MFTGIIEALGSVQNLRKEGENLQLTLASPISSELKIDQSVSHNGVCLTVVEVSGTTHTVTAINETLIKTNIGQLKVGDELNLERAMVAGARLDGHMVQGHVDQTARCIKREEHDGSWIFGFEHEYRDFFTVEKGSICVNGVSLTVVNARKTGFEVAIIPYTFEHTTFHGLMPGDEVNLEFDIIGKYVSAYMREIKA
jgi:riboflavin synthase